MTDVSATQAIRRTAETIANYLLQQHAAASSRGAPNRPLLVSMQGPQGCGKSTLASSLVTVLEERGLNVLERIRSGPPPSSSNPILLPVFDKSQHNGYGDRAAAAVKLTRPVDVFILEGWSLGYGSLSDAAARERWSVGRVAQQHPWESLLQINANLASVQMATDANFDCHVAEHKMKAANGGKGMSDDDVKSFIDRYMPVYEVFGDVKPPRPTLTLSFGSEREVLQASEA
ncbi:uncharacterized protein EHS24_008787 [Apiotrichum porosum]|uniref:P-loop containing nucleoside triphosphate hydrolase protein n=1 Tax=Apiotrichum porosum TaxID=105984 RepID=A0A427XR75_9TREE|nr:uncharacterized protein EHS24_008787 [Apiotrichum porosum]RSH81344.1 hypothetical protein EHS24_008787 [Apiotrichum porosum]